MNRVRPIVTLVSGRPVPPSNRGTTRSRCSRDDVVIAATRAFARDGYQGARWADVAADLGLTATALYYHFVSKLHCLYTIFGQTLTRIVHEAVAAPMVGAAELSG